MPQASPKSGPVSGSRVSTVTVARGPATATATLPRRALASRRPRTARSTADASGAPVVSERRHAAATKASSADALRSAQAAQTGDVGVHCRPRGCRSCCGAPWCPAAWATGGAWRAVGPSAPLPGHLTGVAHPVDPEGGGGGQLDGSSGGQPGAQCRADATQQVEHVVDELPGTATQAPLAVQVHRVPLPDARQPLARPIPLTERRPRARLVRATGPKPGKGRPG